MANYFLPNWGVLRVSGPDAASWLNALVTCDVSSVRPGKGAYGLLLTKQGKIQAELQIIGQRDELLVAVSGGDAQRIRDVLDGYLIMEDAELEVVSGQFVLVDAAQESQAIDAKAFGTLLWGKGKVGLAYVADGVDPRSVLPSDWSAWSEEEYVAALLRWAKPRYEVDYGSSDNPHEAGLERLTVCWSKGCYLGQEVVYKQDARGKVKRRVVVLTMDASAVVEAGTEVKTEEATVVGKVTTWAKGRAFAQLSAPSFEAGTKVRVNGNWAEVVPLVE